MTEELEIRLAYQEQTIEQLSRTLFQQSRELQQLSKRCRQIESRMMRLERPERSGDEPDPPPPHY